MYADVEWYHRVIPATADFDAAARLVDLMSDISEEHYCAGWMMGTEYTLWQMVQEPTRKRSWGQGSISDAEIEELRRLSDKCGGWWRHSGGEAEFIPIGDWIEHMRTRNCPKEPGG